MDYLAFRNPSDYFYAQHMRKEIGDKTDVLASFKNLVPFKKKIKEESTEIPKSIIEEDIKAQIEKQSTDEKEIAEHAKAYLEQELIKKKMGIM